MSEQDTKQKAEKLKDKFLEAVDIASQVDEQCKAVPDAVYFIALNLLIHEYKSDKMFKDAQKLVEHIITEQKRLQSN